MRYINEVIEGDALVDGRANLTKPMRFSENDDIKKIADILNKFSEKVGDKVNQLDKIGEVNEVIEVGFANEANEVNEVVAADEIDNVN